jgi:TPR repeat protein
MEASKANNKKAMYYIGFFYFNGLGVVKSEVKAIE